MVYRCIFYQCGLLDFFAPFLFRHSLFFLFAGLLFDFWF